MTADYTILIVDDEPHAQDVISGFLTQQGYTFAFAANGQEAINYVHQYSPDVILLDVMMPELDGFETCRRLKSNKETQHIPIIIVTALGSKQDLKQGFEAGADDFLSKPVTEVELRARVRSMLRIKQQYDNLKAMSDLREDLARMILHDMRTPLNVILGYTELYLEDSMTDADRVRFIEDIQAQVYRLDSFLTDMLLMTKMEEGQLLLKRSRVSLDSLVQQVIKDHTTIAQPYNIQLVLEMPNPSPEVWVDINLFQRVLDNLLSNAVKYSPNNGTVKVQITSLPRPENSTSAAPSKVSIKISDEGPGILEEYQERIFEKFEVAKLKDEKVPQIGLGLAFCKMIVEAHDGRIFMQNNTPTGSIFTVEI
jgi:signal transduction histidine kinase